MVLKGDIIKEMTGIDMPAKGVPSSAIWNPSDSVSSSSTVSSSSNSNKESKEEAGDSAKLVSSSTEAFEAALPSAGSMETNSSLKAYGDESAQGSQTPDDDDRMGAMLSSSINTAHGSDSDEKQAAKARREEKKNNKLFGSTPEQREKFIQSMASRSDEQLRIQLWDSFRLARVILGKPVKDKRKLSHKSILHAIRKVAEMKIQIIRMAQELDRYKQKEKKYQRLKKLNKLSEEYATSPDAKNQKEGESAVESSSPSLVSPSNGDTPDYATDKIREQAIEILQQESDLALSQITEIEQQREQKRQHYNNTRKLLGSPPITPRSPEMGTIFLSPSYSEDDASEYSYNAGGETATEILYAFKGKRSPHVPTTLSPIMDSDSLTYASERDEIRRVLQSVVDFESQQQNKHPEITTEESAADSTTQMHQEVIALLTRLSTTPSALSPQLPESGSKQSPAVLTAPNKFTFDEPEPELTNEDLLSSQTPLNELEGEEIAQCQAELEAAKLQDAESKEEHTFLLLQKEILQEDIATARELTTSDREKVQLQRLKGYKNELAGYLRQEEERAKQMEALDVELNDMATVCVKLEDRESAFAKKHEQHMATLGDFQAVSKLHLEKFRSLMGAIDHGIKEQTILAYGESDQETDSSAEEIESIGTDASDQKIQRLEYLLTKQNMEVFRLKAELKAAEETKENKIAGPIPSPSQACC